MARKNIPRLKDLAARIGCSSRSLTNWLSGAHRPSAYYLGQLSRVLGTDARRFLGTSQDQVTAISRRTLIAGAAIAVTPLIPLSHPNASANRRSESHRQVDHILSSLSAITRQYRTMQRDGLAGIEEGLRGHIATIQGVLETTVDDRKRGDL